MAHEAGERLRTVVDTLKNLDQDVEIIVQAANNNNTRVSELEAALRSAQRADLWRCFTDGLKSEINNFCPYPSKDGGMTSDEVRDLFLDLVTLISLNGMGGYNLWTSNERGPISNGWMCLRAVLSRRDHWVSPLPCICNDAARCIELRPFNATEKMGVSEEDVRAMIRRKPE